MFANICFIKRDYLIYYNLFEYNEVLVLKFIFIPQPIVPVSKQHRGFIIKFQISFGNIFNFFNNFH